MNTLKAVKSTVICPLASELLQNLEIKYRCHLTSTQNVRVKPEVIINTMYATVDTHTLSLDKEIIFLQLLILNFP